MAEDSENQNPAETPATTPVNPEPATPENAAPAPVPGDVVSASTPEAAPATEAAPAAPAAAERSEAENFEEEKSRSARRRGSAEGKSLARSERR
jgi:hypothetical protein